MIDMYRILMSLVCTVSLTVGLGSVNAKTQTQEACYHSATVACAESLKNEAESGMCVGIVTKLWFESEVLFPLNKDELHQIALDYVKDYSDLMDKELPPSQIHSIRRAFQKTAKAIEACYAPDVKRLS